jgi:catechol 2,3-dioxygenase-like lactoylglutathione lyase family enzyme
MKRFHVNVAVSDLDQSVGFYNTLFGTEPTVHKDDYAKWMLEDPRINFSINASKKSSGVNHIGLQADTLEELGEIQERLATAEHSTFDQPDAECCYAKSTKTWVRDPDDVAWETFVTHGEITHYGGDLAPGDEATAKRCCG